MQLAACITMALLWIFVQDISQKKNVVVFFCILDKDECYKRAMARPRAFSEAGLKRRLERDYPADQEAAFKEIGLAYYKLDMHQDIAVQVQAIEKYLEK